MFEANNPQLARKPLSASDNDWRGLRQQARRKNSGNGHLKTVLGTVFFAVLLLAGTAEAASLAPDAAPEPAGLSASH